MSEELYKVKPFFIEIELEDSDFIMDLYSAWIPVNEDDPVTCEEHQAELYILNDSNLWDSLVNNYSSHFNKPIDEDSICVYADPADLTDEIERDEFEVLETIINCRNL